MRLRPAEFPRDLEPLRGLDTSFVTDAVYRVVADETGVGLAAQALPRGLRKTFPLDDLDDPARPWRDAWVAEDDDVLTGFAAAAFNAWNRRMVLWHLYVAPGSRGVGVGRSLVEAVQARGEELGARHLWLETSSVNAPGIAAYKAMGFSLSGADMTLYDATPAEGEVALFFSRPLAR